MPTSGLNRNPSNSVYHNASRNLVGGDSSQVLVTEEPGPGTYNLPKSYLNNVQKFPKKWLKYLRIKALLAANSPLKKGIDSPAPGIII